MLGRDHPGRAISAAHPDPTTRPARSGSARGRGIGPRVAALTFHSAGCPTPAPSGKVGPRASDLLSCRPPRPKRTEQVGRERGEARRTARPADISKLGHGFRRCQINRPGADRIPGLRDRSTIAGGGSTHLDQPSEPPTCLRISSRGPSASRGEVGRASRISASGASIAARASALWRSASSQLAASPRAAAKLVQVAHLAELRGQLALGGVELPLDLLPARDVEHQAAERCGAFGGRPDDPDRLAEPEEAAVPGHDPGFPLVVEPLLELLAAVRGGELAVLRVDHLEPELGILHPVRGRVAQQLHRRPGRDRAGPQ